MFTTLTKPNGKRLTLPLHLQFAISERDDGGTDIIIGRVPHQVTESHDQVTEKYAGAISFGFALAQTPPSPTEVYHDGPEPAPEPAPELAPAPKPARIRKR